MTIHLPNELEREIQAEVLKGHYPAIDDAVAEAVSLSALDNWRQGEFDKRVGRLYRGATGRPGRHSSGCTLPVF